jgi:2-haloacid dehalogenase
MPVPLSGPGNSIGGITVMPGRRIVVFDVGGVLIDWDPRYPYRTMFAGDDAAMERFLSEVCTPGWNNQQDAGRSWADGVAC